MLKELLLMLHALWGDQEHKKIAREPQLTVVQRIRKARSREMIHILAQQQKEIETQLLRLKAKK